MLHYFQVCNLVTQLCTLVRLCSQVQLHTFHWVLLPAGCWEVEGGQGDRSRQLCPPGVVSCQGARPRGQAAGSIPAAQRPLGAGPVSRIGRGLVKGAKTSNRVEGKLGQSFAAHRNAGPAPPPCSGCPLKGKIQRESVMSQ